ncbi:Sec-independent protein translocase protein TatA [compost metagenome]
MGSVSWIHWVIVLVVVILIFGTKKLGNIGADLGKAVKGFKDGIKSDDESPAASPPPTAPSQVADKSTIDIDAKEKNKL